MAAPHDDYQLAQAQPDLKIKACRAMVNSAIAEGRVGLAFQPIVRSGPRPLIAFHEGLTRIRDRDGRTIAAGEFIPAVENTSLVQALDRIALQKTLDMLQADPRQRLSVNMSPNSINDAEWMGILERNTRDHPTIADRLIVEITESGSMEDPDSTIQFMEFAHNIGCSFAIDDFGAGSTAFSHFRKFKFDMVKIDGQFITDIDKNRDNQVLLEAMVKISRHFDMYTVAEFIETEAESAMVQKLGIDAMQGYYYGRSAEMPICLNTNGHLAPLAQSS